MAQPRRGGTGDYVPLSAAEAVLLYASSFLPKLGRRHFDRPAPHGVLVAINGGSSMPRIRRATKEGCTDARAQ